MPLTKNIAMIAVAAITGFSPMGVMLVQDHLERQELASGEINQTVLLNHSLLPMQTLGCNSLFHNLI